MNETKHTPGPWRVLESHNNKHGFIAIIGPAEPAQHICDVFPFGKRAEGQSLDEHTNNARLIAAAPDLKERGALLSACAADFAREQTDINAERLALAIEGWNSAIAKAEGSS